MRHRFSATAGAATTLLLVSAFLGECKLALADASPQPAPSTASPSQPGFDINSICGQGGGANIPTGSAAEADDYFRALAGDIGFMTAETISDATLADVLAYLGYAAAPSAAAFGSKDLQDADPAQLMDAAAMTQRLGGPAIAAGDVLSARFFAPKISDVSGPSVVNAGWRKLVRFRPREGSSAKTHGIKSAYVLFNFFAPIGSTQPFLNADSANTQVILVETAPGLSPIYWLDFGVTSQGAKLSRALDAFFDAGHTPSSLQQSRGGKRSYFVPCACIACHGGLQLNYAVTPPAPTLRFDKPLLDYLDTDHWNDRVQPGDDFAGLAAPQIADANGFDVIRALNSEIAEQNGAVQPNGMQHRAVLHWLALHSTSSAPITDLIQRSLPGTNAISWTGPDDRKILAKLNRYCFRCHGTVEFDVFDKSMVTPLRLLLLARLVPRQDAIATTGDPRVSMPPDRDLDPAELATLQKFVSSLH